ncbi:ABC transporter ATP-binding protein [Herbiconiux solani]|uniref:ABC transporter ATP-binding protein n=1 Tax=Herbiconiux solani TaxID=661329 RepID=UPI0009FEFED6|nr:ABC transporter ATP-binding protein [Herbiconiux solani]
MSTSAPNTVQTRAVVARNLTKMFGSPESPVHALRGVDLDVAAGSVTAIMGPSGSGKSTLLQVLAGLDTPTSGQVWLAEQEITGMRDEPLTLLRRQRMGFVFQAFNLLPALSAEENIRLPFLLAGSRPSADDEAWIRAVVTRLGLTERLSHRPHQLSGGQQQRVAIARALVTRPDVIFADEPSGALDSASGDEVLGLLRSASTEYGQTVVLITHDPRAASVADRVILMSDGAVIDDFAGGTAEQISARVSGRMNGHGAAHIAGIAGVQPSGNTTALPTSTTPAVAE